MLRGMELTELEDKRIMSYMYYTDTYNQSECGVVVL